MLRSQTLSRATLAFALVGGLAACGDDGNGTSDTGITTASSTEGATSGATTESMTTAGPETGSTTGGGETTTDGDTTTSETAATEPIMTTDATTEDPTGTTTGSKPHPADRKIDVVDDDKKLVRRQAMLAQQSTYRGA